MENLGIEIGKLPEWLPVVGGAFYVGLEYYLGKTTKIKSSSVLEAVLSGIGAFYKAMTKKPPQV